MRTKKNGSENEEKNIRSWVAQSMECGRRRTIDEQFYEMMKISVITIYQYFDSINILANILTQNIGDVKINKNSKNILKFSKKLYKK